MDIFNRRAGIIRLKINFEGVDWTRDGAVQLFVGRDDLVYADGSKVEIHPLSMSVEDLTDLQHIVSRALETAKEAKNRNRRDINRGRR